MDIINIIVFVYKYLIKVLNFQNICIYIMYLL